MGLDGVEIIMGVEETFGMEIPNDVGNRIRTPGELVDYIASQVATSTPETCLTQQLFYRLRRGFKRQVAALAPSLALDTELSAVLHKDQWPKVWTAVRADVGVPEWPEIIPWPGLLKEGPKTVRQLIWHIVEKLPRPDLAAGGAWTKPMIEAQVRRIVRQVTGIKDFSLRDDFVKDLGID
jgi:hypothetical protein